MKKSAFTIIELLIVIAVIAILAGMLLAAMGAVRSKGHKSQTSELFKSLDVAIMKYYEDTGAFPPSYKGGTANYHEDFTEDATWGSTNLYEYVIAKGYGEVNERFLQEYAPDKFIIIDGWGNEILYVHSEDYGAANFIDPGMDGKKTGTSTVIAINSSSTGKPRKANEYQLRSMGENLHDDAGSKDDVTNF